MGEKAAILIIEDHSSVRQTIMDILASRNYSFSEAESGEQALKLLEQDDDGFDVIILDLKLPGMDGIETLKRARGMKAELAPTSILTGSLDPEFENEARELGVFRYLKKSPLEIKPLRDAVREAIEPS